MIEISDIGIIENEATILLGNFETQEELDRLKWAQINRHLKPFIRSSHARNVQVITFAHKILHKVGVFLFFLVGKAFNKI